MSSNLIAAINTIRLICADSEFHQRHAGAHGVRDHRPRGCSSFAVTTRNEKLRQPCSHLSLTRNWHTRIHTHTHTYIHTYIHTGVFCCRLHCATTRSGTCASTAMRRCANNRNDPLPSQLPTGHELPRRVSVARGGRRGVRVLAARCKCVTQSR